MAIIEHRMPAVYVGEDSHNDEDGASCWCKPTKQQVDAEHEVWTHNRPKAPVRPK